MNEYFETYQQTHQENTEETVDVETSPAEFAGLGAIPKTPLQRYLTQPTWNSIHQAPAKSWSVVAFIWMLQQALPRPRDY